MISELDQVHTVINLQREKYVRAIKQNENLEKVKVIYLKIKGLEEKANQLMTQTTQQLNEDFSQESG